MDATVIHAGTGNHPAGLLLRTAVYPLNQRAAFHLACAQTGSICGSLTVNAPAVDLADDQLVVSADWNVPPVLKAALLASRKFARVGRSSLDGQGCWEIWRITSPDLLAEVRALRSPRQETIQPPAEIL